MNPNFDMTGVAVLTGLAPERSYTYKIGYYFSDVELDDARFSESESDWSEASTGSFTTASENGEKSRTLVIGSAKPASSRCRQVRSSAMTTSHG
jgi:alkaline phosphatase D